MSGDNIVKEIYESILEILERETLMITDRDKRERIALLTTCSFAEYFKEFTK